MATEARLVGPFPPDVDPEAYDRLRRRILWSMPSGLYVLGTRGARRRNLMTLNWATQVAVDPKLLAVSVEAGAVSHALLREGQVFPSTSCRATSGPWYASSSSRWTTRGMPTSSPAGRCDRAGQARPSWPWRRPGWSARCGSNCRVVVTRSSWAR
jgi:Flavin reductase like domain